MEKEIKQRLIDFFEPSEFADYLGITVEDMIDAFPEKLEERILEELEELMEFSHG